MNGPIQILAHWLEEAGSNKVIVNLQLADMPHWKTVKNLTLFAEEVLPRLRKLSPPLPAPEPLAAV